MLTGTFLTADSKMLTGTILTADSKMLTGTILAADSKLPTGTMSTAEVHARCNIQGLTCMDDSMMVTATTASCTVTSFLNMSLAWAAT